MPLSIPAYFPSDKVYVPLIPITALHSFQEITFVDVTSDIKQITLINEQNWSEISSNIQHFPFRISEINSLHKDIQLSKVSFKYNIQGKETYYNGSKQAALQTGEYLIATNQDYCEVQIPEGHTKDLGVCVDINIEYLLQAIQSYLQPNKYLLENDKLSYFIEDAFFIKYTSNKEFHRYMLELFESIKNRSFCPLQEMEFEFIRHFLFHQTPYLLAYKHIPVIKKSTRNDLYAKMIEARNILHDTVDTNISIAELSRNLYLSEYRLFHLFKATFQVSPHKYLLQLKLQKAMQLYQSHHYTWTEIADKLQFADVQTFSKLFRKHIRMSPSEYGKSGSAS